MPLTKRSLPFLLACGLAAAPAAGQTPQGPPPPSKASPQWQPVQAPPAPPPAAPQPQPSLQPQPPPASPARDMPPPPAPAPPNLGQSSEESVTTTTTTKKSGGIIISNNASGTTTTVQVGNYGWGGAAGQAPAAFPRPGRDFATPPDAGTGTAPAVAPGVAVLAAAGPLRAVPLAQASQLDLDRPGLIRRQWYAWFPGHRWLGTPRAVVPSAYSIPVVPAPAPPPVPLVVAAPAPPPPPPQQAVAVALPVAVAPAKKSCLPRLGGR